MHQLQKCLVSGVRHLGDQHFATLTPAAGPSIEIEIGPHSLRIGETIKVAVPVS